MLLVADVGNTNIKFGVYKDKDLICTSRLATNQNKTQDEYAIQLVNIFKLYGLCPEDFEGYAISSVVPTVTSNLANALSMIIGKKSLIIGPGIKTGLNIRIDDPTTLGSDIVASGIALSEDYELPGVVISMGTATAIFVVDKDKNYIGGSIAPGVMISLNALTNSGALLPDISLEKPKKAISTDTVDSIRSGVVLGNASMIDGMLDIFTKEHGEFKTVVATGGIAPYIVKNCRHKIIVRDDLILEGLRLLFYKNL
ncbi:MAG: type III pantothenate kinase [Acutalibacteraceae bacterium]